MTYDDKRMRYDKIWLLILLNINSLQDSSGSPLKYVEQLNRRSLLRTRRSSLLLEIGGEKIDSDSLGEDLNIEMFGYRRVGSLQTRSKSEGNFS